ncbi:hypothetical protein LTR08_001685 [Meristemomyces frigidus]|nr:hypothetical protein LTR08_001685 [Meristemomyces frigidus]
MPPPPFAVEQWMNKYETTAKYNLAETCCAPLSLTALAALSETPSTPASLLDLKAPLTYGEIPGSLPLRTNLSRLYSSKGNAPLPPDNILITPGAIAANFTVFYALIGKGDHVVCHYPTYQQLYSVPASLGAEVSLWKSREDKGWLPDFEELKALVRDDTKLIVLNNPQNPTGAILPPPLLHQITALAASKNIPILSDEVYRPLFHSITPLSPSFPPSLLSLPYTNTITTGSLSKAYSLAGIRVGWLASRNPALIARCAEARDYTTIAVSQLDQQIAAFALSPAVIHGLLGRNIQLARTNLDLLERFVLKHEEFCSWTRPVAGTTAFIKFSREGRAVDSESFCRALQANTGVMFLPGTAFGAEWKGYVRVGFVQEEGVVREGLEEVRKFMRRLFDDVPLAA